MIEVSEKTLQTQFTNNKLNAEDRKISLSDNPISKECISLDFTKLDDYIDSDIQLFKDIQKRLVDLKLVENDPKREETIKNKTPSIYRAGIEKLYSVSRICRYNSIILEKQLPNQI